MVDIEKAQAAVRLLLEALGENPEREGLVETPKRVAQMYTELLAGYDETPETHLSKTFNVENNDVVIERDIHFYSLCEHHLLPFFGHVHIAYIPDGQSRGTEQISPLGRDVCPSFAITGADDHPNRPKPDRLSPVQRRHGRS